MRTPVPDDLLLGLLAARSQHGYELLAHFEAPAELGRVWTMSRSQVYAVLKRLQGQGMVRGKAMRGQDAPDRVEYGVTAAGRRKLADWLLQSRPSASVRSIRVEFISKLYIADLLNHPLEPIITCQEAACLSRLGELEADRASAASATESRSLDFVIRQLRAAVAWLDGLRVADPAGRKS